MASHPALARGADRYDAVMAVLVVGLVLAASESVVGRPVIVVVLSASLVFALWTSGARRIVLVAATLVVVVGLAASILVEARPGAQPRAVFAGVSLVICAATIVSITRRLTPPVSVSVRTLSGSLAIYLLSGLTFGHAYSLIDALNRGSFFAQPGPHSPVTFRYFSFTTLTTVGYGDFSAAADGSRLLTVLEALFGQLYLVTVVALVVSQRRRAT